MAKTEFGEGHEFPTEWHRDAYVEGLERELAGAKIRDNADYVKAVEAELARVKPKRVGRPPKDETE